MNNCTKVASQRWARPPEGAPPPDWISASRIKIGGWVVALALGMAQAWATRFTMNPDGVSYLDIGDAYWRHDWHNAINAYWSPLYSWILGFFINVIGPTPYWEYPLVHLVNFFIYVFALACFEYFLSTFIAHSKGAALSRQNGFDESSWRLLGYGLFISSSLILVGTGLVTPDMLVVGVFYLASALLLQVGAPHAPLTTYAELGIVLGIGYLTKTVMFPLAFIFLIVAGFSSRLHIDRLRRTGLSVLLFVAVCTPLITAISFQKHHLTFGETGSWNYAFYVDGVPYWVGNSPGLTHPMRLLSTEAPVYEFGAPVAGTFPPWYDPTYWHEGIKPHFTIRGELPPLLATAAECFIIFLIVFLNVSVGAMVLYAKSDKGFRREHAWAIAIPAAATLLLYALVHIEWRFVAAQVAILFLCVFSSIVFSDADQSRRLARNTVVVVVSVSALIAAFVVFGSFMTSIGPVYADAAAALSQDGVRPGDRIALVWNEKWNAGAAEGAFVPRLLRLNIVAEETGADAFWKLPQATRNGILDELRQNGIRAILAFDVPANTRSGWQQLGSTDYFGFIFPPK